MLNLCDSGPISTKRENGRLSATAAWQALSVAIGLLVAGCATLKVVSTDQLNEQRLSESGTPVAHLYLANWGIYLFGRIPILTGDLANAGGLQIPRLFTHNVRVDLLVERLTQESRQRGGTFLTDLRTRDRSVWMPLTLIFWLNEFEASGNASREADPP
jgi:hypothetical protein